MWTAKTKNYSIVSKISFFCVMNVSVIYSLYLIKNLQASECVF